MRGPTKEKIGKKISVHAAIASTIAANSTETEVLNRKKNIK